MWTVDLDDLDNELQAAREVQAPHAPQWHKQASSLHRLGWLAESETCGTLKLLENKTFYTRAKHAR
jgi:hypothetical protein